jgi:lysyl-tRNA synthetase class I
MIDNPILTPTALPTPVGARDSFGEHFSVELDRVLTDWLADLDTLEPHAHHGRASV